MQDSLPSGSGAILEEVSSGPSRRETRSEELKLTARAVCAVAPVRGSSTEVLFQLRCGYPQHLGYSPQARGCTESQDQLCVF